MVVCLPAETQEQRFQFIENVVTEGTCQTAGKLFTRVWATFLAGIPLKMIPPTTATINCQLSVRIGWGFTLSMRKYWEAQSCVSFVYVTTAAVNAWGRQWLCHVLGHPFTTPVPPTQHLFSCSYTAAPRLQQCSLSLGGCHTNASIRP